MLRGAPVAPAAVDLRGLRGRARAPTANFHHLKVRDQRREPQGPFKTPFQVQCPRAWIHFSSRTFLKLAVGLPPISTCGLIHIHARRSTGASQWRCMRRVVCCVCIAAGSQGAGNKCGQLS